MTTRLAAALVGAGAALALFLSLRYRTESYWPAAFETQHERYNLPLIVAHKAAGLSAPANTLEAVKEHLGGEIGGLELDVQVTRDGVPVIFHADHLQESTDCSGAVASMRLAELDRCRYRSPGNRPAHRIPTLDAVLHAAAGKKLLFLDAKDSSVLGTGLAEAVAEAVRRNDAYDRVVVESFNPFFLLRMRRIDRRVPLMFDFADDVAARGEESQAQLDDIPWVLRQERFRRIVRELVRPDVLGPRYSVDEATIRRLSALGYPIVAWTVDDPGTALRLFALGVNSIQSNEPVRLARAARSARLRRLDDASRSNAAQVAEVVKVRSMQDVKDGFSLARREGKKVSIAGRRHSMGPHSFAADHVVLDMTGLRGVRFDPGSGVVTAQAGATWLDVQRVLDRHGRSVKVMQSDNIFTVGGSLSVNAHGWQTHAGPISSTVRKFTIVLPSGEVRSCSRTENAELFRAALGGFGAFGAIVDAELSTVENRIYRRRSWYVPTTGLESALREKVLENPKAELAYSRLAVDSSRFLAEASVNVYETVKSQPRPPPPMSHEPLVRLKWRIFRASERSDNGKARRWMLERHVGGTLESSPVTRNSIMGPDIHVLWPEDQAKRDVLQEYFVPVKALQPFVAGLKRLLKQHSQNLLNVTIREVRKDDDTLLRYAPEDRIGLVLFFSQEPHARAEEDMASLTRGLADLAMDLGGSFYLPYRMHYSAAQFRRAYPMWREFARLRKVYDPEGILSSGFLRFISP